ncbi:MAG: phage protease [Pseudomonadota bacterium]
MPDGTFHARAHDTSLPKLLKRLSAWHSTDIALDYKHQNLDAEKNGKPTPTSDWLSSRCRRAKRV